jgi:hypothetical protein
LSFKRVTTDRSEFNNSVLYDVVLDEVPGIPLVIKQGFIKYLGPVEIPVSERVLAAEVIDILVVS